MINMECEDILKSNLDRVIIDTSGCKYVPYEVIGKAIDALMLWVHDNKKKETVGCGYSCSFTTKHPRTATGSALTGTMKKKSYTMHKYTLSIKYKKSGVFACITEDSPTKEDYKLYNAKKNEEDLKDTFKKHN